MGTSSALTSNIAVFFAEWFPYLVLASVVLYEAFHRESKEEIVRTILRTAFVLAFSSLTVLSLKHFFPSPRPFVFFDNIVPLVSEADLYGSFPSAHAMFFGSLVGIMFANGFAIWKWYLGAAIFISVARVAVGVHWPIDVTVGLFLGIAFGYLTTMLLLRESSVQKGPMQK